MTPLGWLGRKTSTQTKKEMCTARPKNKHSPWKLRSWDIGEKAKQNSARNNASSLSFQHFPHDLGNVKAWKTMFDPYSRMDYFKF